MKETSPKTYLADLAKKQFTLDWHKELGWKENPFKNQILEPIEYFITGYEEERQKLNYFVIQHQPFGTIAAEKGCGATTLALWLRDELSKYKGRTPAVYLPLTGLGAVDFLHTIISSVLPAHEKAFINTYYRLGGADLLKRIGKTIRWRWLCQDSFYSSIAFKRYTSLDFIRGFLASKLKDKHLVIILDRAEHMHKQHAQILQSFFYAHLPIQVMAVGTKEALAKAPLRIIQKKDALRIRLAKLTAKETHDMIAKRILYAGGQTPAPITEALVKKMYDKYEKNPRQILSACQDYCVKVALNRMRERQEQAQKTPQTTHIGKRQLQGSATSLLEASNSKPEREALDSREEMGPPLHPFTGEKVSGAAAGLEQPEKSARPSFEIPAEILKQIETEELQAKVWAKKDSARKKRGESYSIKVHSNEPTDEEVAIVETLIEEPKEESKIKAVRSLKKKR